ncbi:hypothetical protein NDN08_004896 [Rhodosorus marinus]|uniref:Uncharacterized protein n=1 Tax=Rhodosorus marinus TaxID=101924 RepID=A0AAV8UF04_9RHOD|nr:hypothetical protein NDN08_004896 [Rhodosorus marinus]
MAKTILFGCVLVGALYVSVALGANVVAITGDTQDTIQVNDVDTLSTVQTIVQFLAVKLSHLISLENYIYAVGVNSAGEGVVLQFEILNGNNKLEFVTSTSYGTECTQPSALTATYDYSDEPALAMSCIGSGTTLVMDPETLQLIQLYILPEISDISASKVGDVAMTANYLYATYTTLPQSDDDKSEGLLVQYSTDSWEIVNWSIIRGPSSHLKIGGSSDLFLTSTGNGASYLSQLNPNTLEEVNRRNPQGFEFLQMNLTPNLKSLFLYIQKSGLNAGRVRNFDQTKYPAEKSCDDVRIELSPATSQPLVFGEYLFIRSSSSMTRFTFGHGCPRQKSQTSYGLTEPDNYSTSIAIACRSCVSIS